MTSTREKISVEEACEFLECEKPKLMALLREGELPGLKEGKAWVIPRQAFFEAVNNRAHAEALRLRTELQRERDAILKATAAIEAAKPRAPGAPRRARSI